ncbi:MAG: CBS domain-containing protein [Planctomycetota bacterium]|nr:MAG: CBS domain-containing protein [Planctomycetota bacterium]REJ91458.1 MAG: CBS domain-containing protein [Planctomycetota bacterium]REK25578.1 MAG: CBS domain-containing protein [Planctomycetota bacterium]REK31710.1 MAG: CBS domain-containing protein [Planctomycetota bacterium]
MQGTARDAMSADALTMSAEQPLHKAIERLAADGECDVYIVNEEGALLGIVPDYELLKARLLDASPTQPLAAFMTPAACVAEAETPLCEVAVRLRSCLQRQMPVVENGRLIGRITRTGLLRFLAQQQVSLGTEDAFDPPPRQSPPPPNFLRALRRAEAVNSGAETTRPD